MDEAPASEVRISDYRPARGAVKVGLDRVAGRSGDWSIDIWVTSRAENAGFQDLERLRPKLTDARRDLILRLKRHYNSLGLLSGGLSTRIYTAVCDHGIATPEEFDRWLASEQEEKPADGPPGCRAEDEHW